MNPEYEKLIPKIIEIHKNGMGGQLDWSSLKDSLPELPKPDRNGVRLKMIEMGIIKENPPGHQSSTILIDYYFDLEDYKQKKKQENEKKDIDYILVKKQLDDYPKVQDRADDAIKISKLALLVSSLALLLLVIKWIVSGL